ncbi:MAG: hypothetical protein EAZ55_01120, partial [Cytophagales bacterium]
YEGYLGEEIISISIAFPDGAVSEKGIIKTGSVLKTESWSTEKLLGAPSDVFTWSGDTFKFEAKGFDNETGDNFTVYFVFKRTIRASSLQDYCADIEGTMEYTFNGQKKTANFKASMMYCD